MIDTFPTNCYNRRMNISIEAEKRISAHQYFTLLSIGFFCIVLSIIGSFIGVHANPYIMYALIITFFPFAYIGFKELLNNKEYVSNIEINDNYLILVYKKSFSKVKQIKEIPLKEIQQFILTVTFYPNNSRFNSGLKQKVKIKYSEKMIEFDVNPTIGIDTRKWSFTLRLLGIARFIPNFSYKLNTNERGYFMEKDINYFYKNNKKYPYYRLLADDIGMEPIIILCIIAIIAICFAIYCLVVN